MAQKPRTFLSSSLTMDDLIDSMETFESTPSVLEKMQILSHKNAHLTSCQLVRQDLPVTKLQDVYYHSFPSHKKSADKKKISRSLRPRSW